VRSEFERDTKTSNEGKAHFERCGEISRRLDFKSMVSIVNLQENIGKVVGTRHLREEAPMVVYQRLLDNSRRMRRALPYSKGVFRFKTHEEAHEWKWNLILKSAVKNSRQSSL